MSENKQPSFGILRVLGDVKLPSKKKMNNIFNNPETPKEQVIDLEERLKLINLWKHDEIIHDKQFKKIRDLDEIEIPKIPKKFFGLLENKEDPEYLASMQIYNETLTEINKTNSLLSLYQNIFKQQKHLCYFCGFYDKKFMEIHHKNRDHEDDSPENLVAACTLCHRQHHTLWLSQYNHAELGVASIDYLPQTELNHLQRISIVMKDHPDYKNLLGPDGKLGSIIQHFSNSFSKPLHAFMIPDSEKDAVWNTYISQNLLTYKATGVSANYSQIEIAIGSLGTSENKDKNKDEYRKIKNAIDEYDLLIDMQAKKSEFVKSNPQAPDPTESIRLEYKNTIVDYMEKYKKDYQDEYEKRFNEDTKTFNLFELAIALKEIDYKDYQSFNPKYMFLIFHPNIFTKEQIDYYQSMEYFDIKKWGYGDR